MSKIRTNRNVNFLSGLTIIFAALLCCVMLSCSQESIFFDISNEPEPKDPLIPGTPTSMVVLNGQLFVGGRMGNKIFRYATANGVPGWSSFTLPANGSLGELATDGTHLYALIFPSGNPLDLSVIKKYNPATSGWEEEFSISQYSIQTLYGAGGRIFAGGQLKSDYQNYAIIYLDPSSPSLIVVKYRTALLKGAARDGAGNIYLATQGNGIFRFSGDAVEAEPESGTKGTNIAGIVSTGGVIVAVSSNGNVYTQNSSGGFGVFSTSINFTGAMSVWADRGNQWKPSLLLMGMRSMGSSLTHGYREMALDSNGRPTSNIKFPGDGSPTSIKNQSKYTAGIGTHPVEAILQIPDSSSGGPLDYHSFSGDPEWEPPIFASTSRSGLWSYRNGEWNAEE